MRGLSSGILLYFSSVALVAADDQVVLQLRWDHQFQFAGYYAAYWQGFYEEAGIEVEIRSAITGDGNILSATEEVGEKRADFGVGAADILVGNDPAEQLVVVASIFQHSAVGFFARPGTNLSHPADLLDLRVARQLDSLLDIELQAMARMEGIDPDEIEPYPHRPDIDHLLNGEVDVVPGYRISMPFVANATGVALIELSPATYGVDFYGDSLFTHGELARRDPDLVRRFREATIEGWQYALDNPEEVIRRIGTDLARNSPPYSIEERSELDRFQSESIRDLALYPVVRIGHVNPNRWRRMHDHLRQLEIVSSPFDSSILIFDPERDRQIASERNRRTLLLGATGFSIAAGLLGMWVGALRYQVRRRTRDLSLSEQRLSGLIENASVAICEVDFSGVVDALSKLRGSGVTDLESYLSEHHDFLEHLAGMPSFNYVNGELVRLFGPKYANVGKHPIKVVDEDLGDNAMDTFRKQVLAIWNRDKRFSTEAAFRDSTGTEIRAIVSHDIPESNAAFASLPIVVADVTEQRELEKRLLYSQKLELIGQLSGGIAHDFNNLLSVIQGNLQLIMRHDAILDDGRARRHLDSALDAVSRGSRLTRRLLAFARHQPLETTVIETSELLHSMEDLLRRSLGDTIELEVRTPLALPPIECDLSRVENAILNLAINARDAMPEGGKLTIETMSRTLDERYAQRHAEVSAGNYVVIAVSDNGSGIPYELQDKVLEPFFTTKSNRGGNGLGLPSIYGMIKQIDGHFSLHSEPGKGTTVKLYFPVTEREADEPVESESESESDSDETKDTGMDTWTGPATILVVDDSESVREMNSDALRVFGHEVREAESARQALDILESGAHFDLLFTDIVMPGGMDGWELAHEARRIHPHLPVLVTSGYTGEASKRNGFIPDEVEWISKPASIDDLEAKVSKLLAANRKPET